jgi:hypothetical protein
MEPAFIVKPSECLFSNIDSRMNLSLSSEIGTSVRMTIKSIERASNGDILILAKSPDAIVNELNIDSSTALIDNSIDQKQALPQKESISQNIIQEQKKWTRSKTPWSSPPKPAPSENNKNSRRRKKKGASQKAKEQDDPKQNSPKQENSKQENSKQKI